MIKANEYGIKSAHALLRQHLDYSQFYSRDTWTLQQIHAIKYAATVSIRKQRIHSQFQSQNEEIDPRLQVYFPTFFFLA